MHQVLLVILTLCKCRIQWLSIQPQCYVTMNYQTLIVPSRNYTPTSGNPQLRSHPDPGNLHSTLYLCVCLL